MPRSICIYLFTEECPEVSCTRRTFVMKARGVGQSISLGLAQVYFQPLFISDCNNWTGLYIQDCFVCLIDCICMFCVVYTFVVSNKPIRFTKRPWSNHGIERCLTPSPRSTEFLSRSLCSQTSLNSQMVLKRIFQW